MVENSKILQEKEPKRLAGDLGAIGIGAAIAGPAGAAIGLGANRLYRWARDKYLANQGKNKSTSDDNNVKPQKTTSTTKSNSEEDLQQKIKKAQDDIKNSGIFEPEVYDNYKFYKTTIYDEYHPQENNFIYLSKKRNGKQAYESFLQYWANKYKEKRKYVPDEEVQNFIKLIQERFKSETNKPCLITVPQYFIIDDTDVRSMAKNSDIEDKEGVIYYDRPSFDTNFAFDVHMSKYKNESLEDDNIEDYKTSLIMFKAFGTKYTYAFDMDSNVEATWPSRETESVFFALGEELSNDISEDRLYGFTKVVTQLVDSEEIITDVYTVAAPLLRKNAKTAQDLEYNANLLDGVGIYTTEEEFKKNYLEDYQKLLDNQMGI